MTSIHITQDNLQLSKNTFSDVYDAVEGLLSSIGMTVVWEKNIDELPLSIQADYQSSIEAKPSEYINI
jgi:hypothetical protein